VHETFKAGVVQAIAHRRNFRRAIGFRDMHHAKGAAEGTLSSEIILWLSFKSIMRKMEKAKIRQEIFHQLS
jgi:hypothetical protein